MSAHHTPHYDVALKSLEWMLPEGVGVEDVTIHDHTLGLASSRASLLVPGHVSKAGDQHHAAMVQRSWRMAPSAGLPRFGFPDGESFSGYSRAVKPASRRLSKMLMAKALGALPWIVHQRSESVTLVTEGESELARTLDSYMGDRKTLLRVGRRDGVVRTAIVGINDQGRIDRIAKYASGDTEATTLLGEYDNLKHLERVPRLSGRTPTPLGIHSGHLGAMMVTDAFDGEPGPVHFDDRVDGFLRLCITDDTIPLWSSSILVDLEARALTGGPELQQVFFEAKSLLEDVEVPRCIVHGDFVPWNIIDIDGAMHVFDWETTVFDGFPEWDRISYVLRSGGTIHRWRASTFMDEVHNLAEQGSLYFSDAQWRGLLALGVLNMHIDKWANDATSEFAEITGQVLGDLIDSRWLHPELA